MEMEEKNWRTYKLEKKEKSLKTMEKTREWQELDVRRVVRRRLKGRRTS